MLTSTHKCSLMCINGTFSAKEINVAETVRMQVLMSRDEADRFETYCTERGFKKSTLTARLIREHLDAERFRPQKELFASTTEGQYR
jgi:hypothetical protein